MKQTIRHHLITQLRCNGKIIAALLAAMSLLLFFRQVSAAEPVAMGRAASEHAVTPLLLLLGFTALLVGALFYRMYAPRIRWLLIRQDTRKWCFADILLLLFVLLLLYGLFHVLYYVNTVRLLQNNLAWQTDKAISWQTAAAQFPQLLRQQPFMHSLFPNTLSNVLRGLTYLCFLATLSEAVVLLALRVNKCAWEILYAGIACVVGMIALLWAPLWMQFGCGVFGSLFHIRQCQKAWSSAQMGG